MEAIKCGKCGAANFADAKFCYACGAPLGQAVVEPPPKASSPYRRFWLQTVLGGLGILLALAACVYAVYTLGPAVFEDIEFKFRTGYEEISGSSRITARELDRLTLAVENFPHPAAPGGTRTVITVDEIATKKVSIKQHTLVQGVVLRKAYPDDLQLDDWPGATVLEVGGAQESVLVLYRGHTARVDTGDLVEMEGEYLPDEEVFLATQVRRLDTHPLFWKGNDIWLVRLALVALVWMVLCVGLSIWLGRLKDLQLQSATRPPSALAALLVVLFLAGGTNGCTIHVITTIQPGGSGSITTTIRETTDNMNFMRRIPGMNGYLEALKQQMRSQGMLVSGGLTGAEEVFTFQRSFASLEEFTYNEGRADSASWVHVTEYLDGDEMVYRMTALVDTRTFYQEIPGVNANARNYLTDEFNKINMLYSVNLPGEVVYHNGMEAHGGQATWQLRMNDLNQVVVEARLPAETAPAAAVPLQAILGGGFLLIIFLSTLLLIYSFARYLLTRQTLP